MKWYDTKQLKPHVINHLVNYLGYSLKLKIIMTNKTAKPTAKIEGLYKIGMSTDGTFGRYTDGQYRRIM